MTTKENRLLNIEKNRLKELLKTVGNKYSRKRKISPNKTKKNIITSNKLTILERKIDNLDNKLNLIVRQLATTLRVLIPYSIDDVIVKDNTSIDSRATDDLI